MGEPARKPYATLVSAKRLNEAIDAQPLSIKALARDNKISFGMIYSLKGGHRKSCTPEFAEALTEALGVPFGELFAVSTSIRTRRRNPSAGTAIRPA